MTESQYITTSHKYQMRMSKSPVKSNCAVMLEYVTCVPMETTLCLLGAMSTDKPRHACKGNIIFVLCR